jgi:histidine triad (HIT) family protein
MTNCAFCELLVEARHDDGRVLFEDERLWVSHELDPDGPTYRGVVMVLLKRHTGSGLAEITDAEGGAIGRQVAQVSRAMREVLGVPWTYTYCFTEGSRHVHQFVVARYPGVPDRFVRLGIQNWPDAPRGTPEEIRTLCEKLREAMRGPGGHVPAHRPEAIAPNDD